MFHIIFLRSLKIVNSGDLANSITMNSNGFENMLPVEFLQGKRY